jgi:UDP-glucose 4-epimerase
MSSILVTGGAGFVGSHFARAAAEAGHRVTVLDDLSAGTRPPAGIELVVGDIADRALVAATIRERGITEYAHFAGKICVGESVDKPAMYFDGNLVKTIALLDVVREHAPRAFLFSSTAAVYGMPDAVPIPEDARKEPINPYGDSKLAVERVLAAYGHAYGLPWAALRYFNAAGAHPDGTLREAHEPETHLIPLVIDAALGRRGPLTVFGDDYDTRDGTCVRDYVHVCDLASAHLAAIDVLAAGRPVGAGNIGSATGFTL